LKDASAGGMTAAEVVDAEALGALLLVEHDLPAATLARASTVIAVAGFRSEELDEHADVVFPAEIYAEKEGTVTHPDGRLQRVRQALGHAGEVRPGWRVLADLCERVGAGTGALTAPMVTALVAEAVPFYAGVTLEEIGGLGVRWQERDAASGLAADELPDAPLADPPAAPEGLRGATMTSLWTGPETEHSPSLRFLSTQPRVELALEDARRAGVENGDEVRVAVDGHELTAIAAVRSAVPEGSVFVMGGSLPDGPVELAVERPLEAVAAGELEG